MVNWLFLIHLVNILDKIKVLGFRVLTLDRINLIDLAVYYQRTYTPKVSKLKAVGIQVRFNQNPNMAQRYFYTIIDVFLCIIVNDIFCL